MNIPVTLAEDLSDIDLRLLRVFHAVARHKGFAAAQDELGISQSTISVHMAALEQRLGMRLCERGRSGFHLTEHGSLVLAASQNLFRSIENFRGVLGSVRGQLMGEIHLCMVDAMCSNRALRLESALAEFTRAAPQVVLHVEIAAPQTALQGLVEEHYHVIVTPMARDASPLKLTRVFAEEQALYCGRGHALLATPDSRLDRALIERQRYAGRTYMSGWNPPYDLRLEPCARASHMESIALLILSGEYIGYLPCHYAAQWVENGEMRALRREDTSYREDFYVGRRRNERNRAAQVLVECLLRQLHDD